MPGPLPGPNVITVVGAGNAAGLFPDITPAPTTPSPGSTSPAAERSVSPAGRAVDVFTSAPATPVLGIIVMAVGFLLMMILLSVRRRINRRPRA
jgi:hypothetical protein